MKTQQPQAQSTSIPADPTSWITTPLKQLLFVLMAVFSFVPGTQAQVVVSLGAEEIYDDNIFIEDELDIGPLLPPTLPPDVREMAFSEFNDGEPNDDLITHLTLSASGATPLGQYLKGAADVTVGGFFFADYSDEDRFTLDSLLDLKAEDTLIPAPYFANVQSIFSSQAASVTAPEGTATALNQIHDARLNLGIGEQPIGPKSNISVGYTFLRHDFLDDFTLGSGDEVTEEPGADYFSNEVNSIAKYFYSDRIETHIRGAARYIDETNIDNEPPDSSKSTTLDRFQADGYVGGSYAVTEKTNISTDVGANFTHFSEEPGTTSEVEIVERDTDELTLAFDGKLTYAPDAATVIGTAVSQSQGTDIDGDLIVSRSVSANLSRTFGDRLTAVLSGRFFQFNTEGGDLNDASERVEATASLQYALTSAISLALGYNYITQDVTDNAETLSFRNRDYDVNRVFISLNTGLVGS